jgi:hypothetical protein
MMIRNSIITVLFALIVAIVVMGCSERRRIRKEQQVILTEVEARRQESQKILTSEDLVDSIRYLNDSGYRVAIMKQAQGWILSSDSLLQEAEKLQQRYDSLDTELFMLDL